MFCPYQDLTIYYLSGRVNPDWRPKADGFIGTWEEEDCSFLFFSHAAQNAIDDLLQRQPELSLTDTFQMSYAQWLGEAFTAFDCGRFFIRPPWQPASNDPSKGRSQIQLTLDPGVVFGTGSHPTTRECLRTIAAIYDASSPQSVLDLGTGTGLLALAAAACGARRVIAVDRNPLAVQTAVRNVAHNQLERKVLVVQGKAEELIDLPAELVIANIHHEVMKDIIAARGFKKKSHFLLSGLLRSEAAKVACVLKDQSAIRLHTQSQDGIWHTIHGTRLEN